MPYTSLMEPLSVGRRLGIGARIAAKGIRDKAASEMRKNPAQPPAQGRKPEALNQIGVKTGQQARSVARGSKRFGQAVWGPLAHIGGVLWLEITGLFFALFAFFFGQNTYRLRSAYAGGAEKTHFLVYSGLTLLFIYFTLSSFFKARQREKKKRKKLG